MRAGSLDTRVTIQAQSLSHNVFNESVITWVDFKTVWADVKQLSGRELFAMEQIHSPVTSRVVVRPLAGLIASMRVIVGSRTLTIESVVQSHKRSEYVELMCSEGIVNE